MKATPLKVDETTSYSIINEVQCINIAISIYETEK
ncbi:hypothetical protein HNQ00_002446 [Flavobacterium sp. 14A]|nr:hypothetical protein [Flavobacterium sp. 14A]